MQEILFVVSAPAEQLQEWALATCQKLRHVEDQGLSALFCGPKQSLDFALRMAVACDVTVQRLTRGEWSYGPLAVQHDCIFTVAKNSWEKYELLHMGSHQWHWGHICAELVGTVCPGTAAEAQGGNGPGPGNGCVQSAQPSSKPIQN